MTQFAASDGARIAYDTAGAGPDVVLIHAGVTDRHMWDDVVPLLTPQYRVTRYDMRGFGESVETEPGQWAPRQDLIAVMDAVEVEAACVVGVSMGGGAAVNAVLEWPDRFTHLVPVNAGIGGFDYEPDEWEVSIDGRISEAFEGGRFDECATLEMEMWLAGPHRTLAETDTDHIERMRSWLLTSYEQQPSWQLATRMDPPANDRLPEIALPTLAVLGALDVASMAGVMERISSAVPNGRMVVMEETAHLSPMERPNEFVRHLTEFLATN